VNLVHQWTPFSGLVRQWTPFSGLLHSLIGVWYFLDLTFGHILNVSTPSDFFRPLFGRFSFRVVQVLQVVLSAFTNHKFVAVLVDSVSVIFILY
jgi:hypothetical protein